MSMFPSNLRIAFSVGVLSLGACTWVPMEAGGRSVQVAPAAEDLSACGRAGTVTVSVRDSVAFYERNPLKVRDELETLARNEASSLSADTVQPLGEPRDGEQRFAALRCGGLAAPATVSAAGRTSSGRDSGPAAAETFPIDQDRPR